ncbi:hypothetical protein BG015_003581 [Linnemannia schmuckeri]|uniref:Galactose oxidase n=1 Tax=Linnemannia schmuckeri TaxID=64567 RepID=A0A9P5VFK1_9FUNG|nr:hypothetical protein BG015_003581 [Linnemannia schmuckeri]
MISNPDFNMVAVADPINNSVYVVNGWQADSNMSNPVSTMRYDQATAQIFPAGNSVPMSGGYAAVWSTKRSSILVHGGYNKARTVMQRVLYEYIPITEYAGIFIFDVATLTWTQGQTGDSTVGRAYAACAVTNDMFVAWGGATQLDNNFSVVKTPTVVYNLKTNGNGAWQKNFSPDNVVASSHVGSIVGGVIGGMALISAMVLGFVVYRRKQRKRAEKNSLSKGEGATGSGSISDDSITLKHEGGEGTQRSTYVVHAPVTDITPMAPTGYESTAYTAIGYAQPGSQPQPQVYNPVRYTPPTQQIYDPATSAQGHSIVYQPPLVDQPYVATDSPQFQHQRTAYQLPPHHDPSAGYLSAGYAGYSPPVVAPAVPSPSMAWTNSPTVTAASATTATDASGAGGGEPRVTVGGNGRSTAMLLLLRLSLVLTTTTTISHVQAQAAPPPSTPALPTPTTGPYSPTPLYNAHSVFVEGRALYVHGGIHSANNAASEQTFALDLSVSWKTNQPAFKQLSNGFPSSGVTSALFQDKDTWMMINGNQFVTYYIYMDEWNKPGTLTEMNPLSGFPAVTDYSTGLVYYVNGFNMPAVSATAVGTIPVMMMIELINGTYQFSSMPTTTGFSLAESGYASCWSTLRKSIFLHGGIAGSPVAIYQKTLFEFDTAKSTFTTINESGDSPSARSGHCLVEAYNGTKIVLFGGVNQTSGGLSDIYILDVATLKWTQGKPGGAGVGRANAACAVTNDRFVAWGGATRINGNFVAVTTSATVVYDFIQNKWITTFSPLRTNTSSPDPEPDPLPPTAPDDEETTSPSSSKGALIGGIAGGVVVIAAIAVFIFFRRRRRAARRKQKREKQMPSFQNQRQQQQRSNTRETEKKDDEEEEEGERGKGKPEDNDNGEITYVVGARAMPASPTESSFRDSGIIPQSRNYQQLQQQQQPLQQPFQQPLQQPLQPLQEQQQQAFHSASGVPFPAPPVTSAHVPSEYTVPVLKFFNPTATTPASPTMTTPSTTTPIPIPSSPVASILPLPPPVTPQRPQSLIPGGFIAPRVVHPPSSSQPKETPIKTMEPSYTTLIPYFSPVASVSSLPTSQYPQSIIPINNNNNNNRAYTNDQYHDQQGKEELHRQQQQRQPPTVEYGPNSSPALSYLAISSQWTSSLGSTPAAPPAPGATSVNSNPYATFTPSPLSNAPTTGPTAGGNAYAAFTPSPLSWYSDSTEARNSLPFIPVAGNGIGGGGDPQKTGDGLVPPITPPRNPHGIQ